MTDPDQDTVTISKALFDRLVRGLDPATVAILVVSGLLVGIYIGTLLTRAAA